jgi:hypothetical protein
MECPPLAPVLPTWSPGGGATWEVVGTFAGGASLEEVVTEDKFLGAVSCHKLFSLCFLSSMRQRISFTTCSCQHDAPSAWGQATRT